MPEGGRAHLDAIVHRSVGPAALAGAICFALLAPAEPYFVGGRAGWGLVAIHGLSAAMFLLMWAAHKRDPLPPKLADPAIATMVGLALVNVHARIALGGGENDVVQYALLVIGAGSVMLSPPWFALVIASAVGDWLMFAATSGTDARTFAQLGPAIASAAVIGFLVLYVRVRMYDDVAEWRQLVQNAPDVIFTVDVDGKLLFINRPPPHTTEADLVGRCVYEIVPEGERDAMRQAFDRVVATGRSTSFEAMGLGADGQVSSVKSSVGPIWRDGEVRALMVISTDITAQKRAEEERVRGEEKVREIERLKNLDAFKTAFINTAAHELGTPLTPIKMQLHLLKVASPVERPPAEKRALDILDRNIARLGDLLKDVLDAARVQSGHFALRRQPFDLARAIDESVETFLEPARQAGIALEWRKSEPLMVEADVARVTQILFNFLSNSIKFTPEGGTIRVDAAREANEIVVRVSDTGHGLRDADLARLFQPFTQVHDAARTTVGGTGLGLYISRGIIEQHGGRIWGESAGPGKGATFAFALPAA